MAALLVVASPQSPEHARWQGSTPTFSLAAAEPSSFSSVMAGLVPATHEH
jgi:hypothetical protein